MSVAEIVAGAVKGTADTGLSIWNAYQSYKNNQYQKDLQKQIFAREDNAIQRRVADAEKAGFNKFSVIGEGSNAGSAVSVQAPHISEDMGSKIADSLSTMYSLATQKAAAKKAETDSKEAELAFSFNSNETVLAKAQQLQSLGFNVGVGSNRYGDLFLINNNINPNEFKKWNKYGTSYDFFDRETKEVKDFDNTPAGIIGLNQYRQNQIDLQMKEFEEKYQWLPPLMMVLRELNNTAGTINSFRRPKFRR